MRINVIGECDKRVVIYTLMKICQELGDVLVITDNTRLKRLPDTGESGGHYQNCMIEITQDGLDDFLEDFTYDLSDFNFTIIDNIIDAEADLTIYVEGYKQSEAEKDTLEYIDSYQHLKPYTDKLLENNTYYKLEEFECLRDMCVVAPKIAEKLATVLANILNKPAKNIIAIALKNTSAPIPKGAKSNSPLTALLKGGKK